MLLTLTSTAPSASDLGYLLHKNPSRVQSFDLPSGQAHVFYPEATDERCTVALLLELDPIELARAGRGADRRVLAGYLNDRPYAASSLLAVALSKVFSTALRGVCVGREDLADTALPLEIHLPVLPCPGGPERARDLFEPLGWLVEATPIVLDPALPEWGDSRYVDLRLTGAMRVADALSHLYVLIPVLDGDKHYWVNEDEVDKLLRRGGTWLADHPLKDWIVSRYLARQRPYVDEVMARLAELDGATEAPADDEDTPTPPLARLRAEAVVAVLHEVGAHRIVDLGCGQGALLRDLIKDASFTEIIGADVSASALAVATKRLQLHRMPDAQRARLQLIQSSATYRDARLAGMDAIVLMEVIEHLDPDRLPDLEHSVFAEARPQHVVVTTPNADYNVRYPGLAPGAMRHPDHRFEWNRAEFAAWAARVAADHTYAVTLRPVGDDDPEVGSPTQLAIFTRTERS